MKKNCKHGFLSWVADGDRRLICKKCKKMFVIIDEEITEIDDDLNCFIKFKN